MPRSKNYEPGNAKPHPLSRSKLQLFHECPRCFYFDQRRGLRRPSGPPFTLNDAVDRLLKREFDSYRTSGTPHPLLTAQGIAAVPFLHPELDNWRNFRRGLRVVHPETNFEVYGALDDVWQESGTGRLIVADYKATAKTSEVGIDSEWQISYKRQVELYQWLLRGAGFDVCDTAWFVYANGDSTAPSFGAKLEFRMTLIPYVGGTAWVPPALVAAKSALDAPQPPRGTANCPFCGYYQKRTLIEV